MIFYLDQRVEAFFIKRMIEIDDRNQRTRGLVNMVDGVEHQPSSFVELSKTHEAAHCSDETRRPFDSLFLDVFVQLLSSILIGNNTSLNLFSLFGKSL